MSRINIGLVAAFLIILLTGVIYGRIAGYIGSVLHFADIIGFLLKVIRKVRDKLSKL